MAEKVFSMSKYGSAEQLYRAKVKYLTERLQKMSIMSPAEICRESGVQCCHFCNDIECGDNMSPAMRKIKELTIGTLP